MDPSYSVLLQDKKQDTCEDAIEQDKKGVNKTVLIAVLCSVGGVAILAAALYVLYPRVRLYLQLKQSHKATEMERVSSNL